MTLAIGAAHALSLNRPGADVASKAPDGIQPPASTMKMVTAYTSRRWITNAMLDNTVTITSADVAITGSLAGLQAGDAVTWRDLYHGMMLPSGNDAARAIGRLTGELILAAEGATGSGMTRYLTEAATAAAELRWAGAVIADPSGLDDNSRLTVRHLAHILRIIAATDPFALTVMGTHNYTITVTGANARTIPLAHTIDPNGAVKLPEFVAGKTGTTPGAGAGAVILWNHPDGTRHVTAIHGASDASRFPDLRAVMDEVIANRGRSRFVHKSAGVDVAVRTGVVRSGAFVPVSG